MELEAEATGSWRGRVEDGEVVHAADHEPAESGPREQDDGDQESATREELYERAKELDIEGRSGMSKDELEDAIDSQG